MGNDDREWIEKRRHRRFTIDDYSVVMYRIGLAHRILIRKKNIARVVTNLSEGGACLVVDRPVRAGVSVRMLLMFNKFNDVFEANGRVRWSRSSKRREGRYFVGVQFTGIDPVQTRKMEHIRSWFTSKAYRVQKESARRRQDEGGLSLKR